MNRSDSKKVDRRRLRRILNRAKDFFSGACSTTKLIRSRYGDGINKGMTKEDTK